MKKILILMFCFGSGMSSPGQTVVQGEYFVDADLGFGNNTPITFTPSADNAFPVSINMSSYAPGYHKLYIRTKDNNGNWSFTSRRNVEVLASEAKTTFVKGEYFIDSDPGFGLAIPITIATPDSVILQNFSAVASTLSEGYHKLYGRFEDNLGRWSITFRRNMEVYKDENNKVVNGEFFFTTDNGFGDCAPVTFTVPLADGAFVVNIPLSAIPPGADTMFVRVRDDIENRWSLTQFLLSPDGGPLPLTILNFSAVKQLNTAQLHWQTANEMNTVSFHIQRSTDAVHFNNVGMVNAVNQNGLNDYSYSDNIEGISAATLYYRLQETDIDGRFTYSKVVSINPDVPKGELAIYPNPARDYFNVVSSGTDDLNGANISIVDLSGKVVFQQILQQGGNQRISISSLAKGMYIIKIVKTTGVVTRKLLKE